MPCLWLKHDNRQLVCAVIILPMASILEVVAAPERGVYRGPMIAANALVNTGATTTCISSKLANSLNIQPIGKVRLQGVAQVNFHNSYLFLIGFPFAPASGVAETRRVLPLGRGEVPSQLHVLQSVIRGCEFDPGNATFDVLLGMDVIRTGTLVVQGDGSFSFSF
jgi:hypothetical protein